MEDNTSDESARLLPDGLPFQKALIAIEKFRRGEKLEPTELFFLLLSLSSPNTQKELGVSDNERILLKTALQPNLG